ncbi:hypothetical protein BKP37_12600 [Anaerobacillus alkalilacustris]|uniref:M23ase beta-sheet core domain-containing protein n=1 Tax=Anaerobacillus alkalilacustris TaxID=393763 RepID=A0A1S2LLS8_9BACI|nr:M23 family metallopeptidase [Anaerobacillus alkalilacustris]OIJ12637.1 hypothetical protein BKP37_12600 [Anaerobacillus alkalilacustris]
MELVGSQYKIRLTSKFGEVSEVRNFRPHTGIDLGLSEGTELKSITPGVVERLTPENTPLGNGIIIRGDDGNAYVYGHLKEIHVSPGQRIEFGEFIGLSGNTGTSTTGPHLHFAVQTPNGEFIDPAPLADTLADLTGDKGFLDGVKTFFENGQVDQYDKGDNVVLDYLGKKVGEGLIYIWDWFVVSLPDIVGYSTILAGVVIILGSMVKRGGAIKVLLAYAAFLILALCILIY